MSKQRVGSDVERDAKKRISRALIKLTMQHRGSSPTIREGFGLFDFELKNRVTRRQIDVVTFAWVPTAHDQPAGKWIRFDLFNQAGNLIHAVPVGIMAAKRSPKITINRAEIAWLASKPPRMLLIGPLFPNVYALP